MAHTLFLTNLRKFFIPQKCLSTQYLVSISIIRRHIVLVHCTGWYRPNYKEDPLIGAIGYSKDCIASNG